MKSVSMRDRISPKRKRIKNRYREAIFIHKILLNTKIIVQKGNQVDGLSWNMEVKQPQPVSTG